MPTILNSPEVDDEGREIFRGLSVKPLPLSRNPFAVPFLVNPKLTDQICLRTGTVDALRFHVELGGKFQSRIRDIRRSWPAEIKPGWLEKALADHRKRFEKPCVMAEKRRDKALQRLTDRYRKKHGIEPTLERRGCWIMRFGHLLGPLLEQRNQHLEKIEQQKTKLLSEEKIVGLLQEFSRGPSPISDDGFSRYAVEWAIHGGDLKNELNGVAEKYFPTAVSFTHWQGRDPAWEAARKAERKKKRRITMAEARAWHRAMTSKEIVVPNAAVKRLCLKISPTASVRDAQQLFNGPGCLADVWRDGASRMSKWIEFPSVGSKRVWDDGRYIYLWLPKKFGVGYVNRQWSAVEDLREEKFGNRRRVPRKRPRLEQDIREAELERDPELQEPLADFVKVKGDRTLPAKDAWICAKLADEEAEKLPRRHGESDEDYVARQERLRDNASNLKRAKTRMRMASIRKARSRRKLA